MEYIHIYYTKTVVFLAIRRINILVATNPNIVNNRKILLTQYSFPPVVIIKANIAKLT